MIAVVAIKWFIYLNVSNILCKVNISMHVPNTETNAEI